LAGVVHRNAQLEHEADVVAACGTCGLVQVMGGVRPGAVARCARCRSKLSERAPNSRARTLAFSLAAAVLYFPANLYPLISAQYHGHYTETTVFQGVKSLFEHQQYFIGVLVFCTSILTPALKIIALIFIPLTLDWERWRGARAWGSKGLRVVDPLNTLEVFLLAISVSMIEIGRVATVHPGRGVFSFAAVVALTLMATLSFDPRLLWDSDSRQNTRS
jgi:paraquat-inducible protein A